MRTEYLFIDSSVPLDMSRIYSAVAADRMIAADALSRGVPEEDEEQEQEDDQEESEEDADEAEGYSE